jgi:hypothetical protein
LKVQKLADAYPARTNLHYQIVFLPCPDNVFLILTQPRNFGCREQRIKMASNNNGSVMDKACPLGPIPVAEADRKPRNIREYLQYVNHTYPGGFRALRLNILNKDKKDKEDKEDTEIGDATEDHEYNGKPNSGKNPLDVHREIAAQVE